MLAFFFCLNLYTFSEICAILTLYCNRYSHHLRKGVGGPMRDTRRPNAARDSAMQTEEIPENLVCGRNAVRELLLSERTVNKLLVQKGEHTGSLGMILSLAKEKKIPMASVDRVRLDTVTGGAKHQGVAAYVAERDYASVSDILACARERGEQPFVVLCDGVEDPHNLGAIIRSAECMGAHGIVIPKRRSAALTPTVAKASAGAVEHLLVARVPNLTAAMEELKEAGVWIYAADMDGEPYFNADLKGAIALVMGSEGNGVSRLVRERCDFVLSIPQWGQVNSLNVSGAAAVLLAEIARQRHFG